MSGHLSSKLGNLPILPAIMSGEVGAICALAEAAFVRAVADGEFMIEPLESEDIARAATLIGKYSDLELGFVDATVIATAERLDATEVLTTDRRHFSAVRPNHIKTFRLNP